MEQNEELIERLPSGLGWSIPANLRWLAEQHDRPGYMPCGMLTGAFLIAAAEKIEELAKRGPH